MNFSGDANVINALGKTVASVAQVAPDNGRARFVESRRRLQEGSQQAAQVEYTVVVDDTTGPAAYRNIQSADAAAVSSTLRQKLADEGVKESESFTVASFETLDKDLLARNAKKASESLDPSHNKFLTYVIAGGSGLAALLLLVCCFLIWCCCCRQREPDDDDESIETPPDPPSEPDPNQPPESSMGDSSCMGYFAPGRNKIADEYRGMGKVYRM